LANQIIKRANPNPNQIVKTEMANQVGFGKSNCQLNENESGQKEASSSCEWQIQIKLPKR
jgi:hypothetical protein